MTAKEDIKKALDGLAQFIIMNDNGTDESASAIEWHNILTKALERAKKEHALLGLYQKKEQCIACVPLMKDSPILHCVVRYSEDEKYMRILNQIKQLEEELK